MPPAPAPRSASRRPRRCPGWPGSPPGRVAHDRVGRAHSAPRRAGSAAARRRPTREAAASCVQEVARDVAEAAADGRDVARAVSAGVADREALLDATVVAVLGSALPDADAQREPRADRTRPCGERGEELLERSRDVWSDRRRAHPAYERILDELAPDEARILLLLLRGGPQPRSTCAPAVRSAWSARSWWRRG